MGVNSKIERIAYISKLSSKKSSANFEPGYLCTLVVVYLSLHSSSEYSRSLCLLSLFIIFIFLISMTLLLIPVSIFFLLE